MSDKLSNHFDLWLKAKHLPPQGAKVTIEKIEQRILHPRPGVEQPGVVVSFVGKSRKLILNQTQANELVELGGDEFEACVGLVIGLKPAKHGTKDTIRIVRITDNGSK